MNRIIPFVFMFFCIATIPLMADTLSVQSVSGTWNNAVSGNGTPSNFSGGGTNFIHWGNPAQGSQNSGYQFVGNAPPAYNVALDTPFAIGTFTHFNFPITGNALTSVDLSATGMSLN